MKVIGLIFLAVAALIAAATMLPCKMSSQIGMHESVAVASIKAIISAEETYRATYGRYADSLAKLGGAEPCRMSAETACFLDSKLCSGKKAGYRFALSVNGGAYVVGTAPERFGRSGVRMFCSMQDDVVRMDPNNGGSTTPPSFEQCAKLSPLQ